VGIQPGDLIVSMDGQRIDDASDFNKAMDGLSVEKGVRMQVMRDGVRKFVFVKVQK
jgi:type II secretory pathway component PulC